MTPTLVIPMNNTSIAADDLIACVTRTSTAMILNMKDKWVFVFNDKANLRDLIAATGLVILLKLD